MSARLSVTLLTVVIVAPMVCASGGQSGPKHPDEGSEVGDASVLRARIEALKKRRSDLVSSLLQLDSELAQLDDELSNIIHRASTREIEGRGAVVVPAPFGMRIFREPSIDAEVLAYINRGESLTLTEHVSGHRWWRVKLLDCEGYALIDSNAIGAHPPRELVEGLEVLYEADARRRAGPQEEARREMEPDRQERQKAAEGKGATAQSVRTLVSLKPSYVLCEAGGQLRWFIKVRNIGELFDPHVTPWKMEVYLNGSSYSANEAAKALAQGWCRLTDGHTSSVVTILEDCSRTLPLPNGGCRKVKVGSREWYTFGDAIDQSSSGHS